ncbi:hypothetical protein OG488_11035 [Streptomyces sp. NBC_01460]|uniref:hypothetical protein n=1 Tax=Streptomyces sp. NBC_01460 TaxID=2903875 RepID=UPI002E37CFE0|nr:hypothetical protein [Streptomyces sp. NBC_01460]
MSFRRRGAAAIGLAVAAALSLSACGAAATDDATGGDKKAAVLGLGVTSANLVLDDLRADLVA